jgi:hypothetical protein
MHWERISLCAIFANRVQISGGTVQQHNTCHFIVVVVVVVVVLLLLLLLLLWL